METFATIIVFAVILAVLAIGWKYFLGLLCICCIGSFLLSGFGIFIFCASAGDLTFVDTPMLSGLIGWCISAALTVISFWIMDKLDELEFKTNEK